MTTPVGLTRLWRGTGIGPVGPARRSWLRGRGYPGRGSRGHECAGAGPGASDRVFWEWMVGLIGSTRFDRVPGRHRRPEVGPRVIGTPVALPAWRRERAGPESILGVENHRSRWDSLGLKALLFCFA
jgi:hypothetical protein